MHEHLIALERELLETSTRQNRARLEQLLAEDFFEFGSSGTVWSREEILDRLPAETPVSVSASNFRLHELSGGATLVTYRTERIGPDGAVFAALRSSIWLRTAAGWQMLFHQGTKA